jgi:hypothetical protein
MSALEWGEEIGSHHGEWQVSNSNDGNGNKDGGRMTATRATAPAMAMATIWAIATATRLVGDKEGKGKGGVELPEIRQSETSLGICVNGGKI